jgi:hypothetical protein
VQDLPLTSSNAWPARQRARNTQGRQHGPFKAQDPLEVTDAGLKEIASIKSLRSLGISNRFNTGPSITDAGLKELAPVKNLTLLDLDNIEVTDAGLKELTALKGLQDLYICNTRVTDTGLKQLPPLKNLRHLRCYGSLVTDAGVAEFKKSLPLCEIIGPSEAPEKPCWAWWGWGRGMTRRSSSG